MFVNCTKEVVDLPICSGWSQVVLQADQFAASYNINDITSSSEDTIFVITHTDVIQNDYYMVLTSFDAGETWRSLYTSSGHNYPRPHLIESINNRLFISAASINSYSPTIRLIRSDDYGFNQAIVSSQACYSCTEELVFFDQQVGYYASASNSDGSNEGPLRKTTDGGETWSNLTLPSGLYSIEVPAAQVIYTISSSVVYKSADAGTSWDTILNYSEPTCLKFIDENYGFVGGSVLLKTMNGGATWDTVYSEFPVVAIDGRKETAIVAALQTGAIISSLNDGESWNEECLPYDGTKISKIHFTSNNVVWAAGKLITPSTGVIYPDTSKQYLFNKRF